MAERSFAANLLPNNEAHLAAWATDAQSLEPEVMMPRITRFTGEELKALVADLRQLE